MTLDERTVQATERRWIALGVLCFAALLISLHGFVLLLAMPAVTAALGASATQQLWILDVYVFMVAGLLITMGSLGDRVGRRRLLLAGAAVFGIVSIVAAYSVDPVMLIAARAVLGVAAAAIVPSTLSLISTLFPDERERVTALGIWGGCFTVGAVVGPIAGGILLHRFWWGSAFLISVPAIVVLLAVGPFILPEYRDEDGRRIDLASAGLSLAAILSAIYGLKQLAAQGLDPRSIAFIVAGAALGWVFVRRQDRLSDPLLDLRLFRRRTFRVVLVSMTAYAMLSGGLMVFVAQYLQLVRGMTALTAGIAMVPAMITSTIAFQLTPRLARRVRPGVLIPVGVAVTVVGMAVMSRTTSTTVLLVAFGIEYLGGAPLALLGTNLVIGSVPPEKAGTAGALTQTGNELGLALGVAVLGSVLTMMYRGQMDGRGGDSLAQAISSSAPPAVLDAARNAFTAGFQLVAGISAVALTVVSVLLARNLRDLPLLRRD
ncbi:MFS transporter [Kribbella solani]|uniref:MFS transporter n=1 Tax=Kribbella solani TaxID=236067 RepID=UPI0029B8A5D2|nr:MFS transporter [Kribbella solani]MDX2971928.1 MFS transporter [Kribbella solani]MDX3000852.1 MFS transporter [Kribbella solani]